MIWKRRHGLEALFSKAASIGKKERERERRKMDCDHFFSTPKKKNKPWLHFSRARSSRAPGVSGPRPVSFYTETTARHVPALCWPCRTPWSSWDRATREEKTETLTTTTVPSRCRRLALPLRPYSSAAGSTASSARWQRCPSRFVNYGQEQSWNVREKEMSTGTETSSFVDRSIPLSEACEPLRCLSKPRPPQKNNTKRQQGSTRDLLLLLTDSGRVTMLMISETQG